MVGRGRDGKRRGIAERLEADIAALAHGLQAFGHKGPVQTFEGNDVAHRCQSHEIEQSEQVRRRRRAGVVAALAELARCCHQQHEHDAGRAEMAEPGDVVLPVGVHERCHVGEALVGLVVIDHDDVGAQGGSDRERIEARRAAIDGDDEFRAVLDETFDGLGIGAVALGEAIGNIDARIEPVRLKKTLQQRGRAGAVDVVVSEYGDGLATLDGVGEAGRAFVHVAQGAGIRHQRLDGGVEGDRHLVRCDVTGREHAAQQLRQLVALADRDGRLGSGRTKPLAPGEAAHGRPDAQIGAILLVERL